MSNVVIIKKINEINEMKVYYQSYLTDKVPPGGIFAAKTPCCSITAYKSGKVLFQGSGSIEESAKWGENSHVSSSKKEKKNLGHLPEHISSRSVIGSDEVGTGDYFGPITVVAAYVKKEQIPLLKELGVKDSKDLNDEKIISIAKQIKDIVPYSLLTLHNEKYNLLQKSGMSQGKMKSLLHNKAIGHVLNKIAPELPEAILIDQFAKEEVYYQYLKNEKIVHKKNVFFSTKAEGIHLAVAAASILARYAFVRHFDQLSKEVGFTITKGAGPKVDENAARLIYEKGIDVLPAFTKLHFANTEKAKQIYMKKYLK
ncbi:ribonuclease HIII [Cytobacillus dafuensis]|uniref:Ribonuclease HIII n=1 Tax=Cytobacillus dafuensis TaxID=1742359 RepID=A0A5B8ZB48_CYTDA|nr:ribonuclease HIII [Cytobacillus dafuensis]QED48859.1 ribonuclease HIII [Cytobacillus dafuensis]